VTGEPERTQLHDAITARELGLDDLIRTAVGMTRNRPAMRT